MTDKTAFDYRNAMTKQIAARDIDDLLNKRIEKFTIPDFSPESVKVWRDAIVDYSVQNGKTFIRQGMMYRRLQAALSALRETELILLPDLDNTDRIAGANDAEAYILKGMSAAADAHEKARTDSYKLQAAIKNLDKQFMASPIAVHVYLPVDYDSISAGAPESRDNQDYCERVKAAVSKAYPGVDVTVLRGANVFLAADLVIRTGELISKHAPLASEICALIADL